MDKTQVPERCKECSSKGACNCYLKGSFCTSDRKTLSSIKKDNMSESINSHRHHP